MAQVSVPAIHIVNVIQDNSDANVANLITLQSRASTALTNNATYLALGSPTTTQNTAQIQALTRQMDGIIRMLLQATSTITDS